MADDILIRYKADTSDLDKGAAKIVEVTKSFGDMANASKAAFANQAIDQAVKKLYEQGDVMGALIQKYGDAGKAMKAMQKELNTMAALGQRNTKEFKDLSDVAAELRDRIDDTRSEIKKMSSDTRVFDVVTQGVRGITAAFSLAQGATALFGEKGKDLQETLLKVQGAMALATGAQELANIATEKGGLATQAYGMAIKAVTAIEETFAVSSAAAWAAVTGGISLVVAAAVGLYAILSDSDDKAKEMAAAAEKQKKEDADAQLKQKEELIKSLSEADKEYFNQQEKDRKARMAAGQKESDVEFDQLSRSIEHFQQRIEGYKNGYYNYLNLTDEEEQARISAMTDYVNEALIKRNEIQDKANADRKKKDKEAADAADKLLGQKMKEQITAMRLADQMVLENGQAIKLWGEKYAEAQGAADEPLITEKTVEKNKEGADKMVEALKNAAAQSKAITAKQIADQIAEYDRFQRIAGAAIHSVSTLASQVFQQETESLQIEKDKQLKHAGDHTKRREKIEREFAIKEAKIKREQAVMNKILQISEVAIQTAVGIAKAESTAAGMGPAGAAYAAATIGELIATAALETATIMAAPLPKIPTFEKGGKVLAGGRSDDGMLYGRSHREGGILIEAQGGEYIWDIPTVQKHGDIIAAAHQDRLEQYLNMRNGGNKQSSSGETFDDQRMIGEMRNGHRAVMKSAEYIVRGVSKAVKESSYFNSRYNG